MLESVAHVPPNDVNEASSAAEAVATLSHAENRIDAFLCGHDATWSKCGSIVIVPFRQNERWTPSRHHPEEGRIGRQSASESGERKA